MWWTSDFFLRWECSALSHKVSYYFPIGTRESLKFIGFSSVYSPLWAYKHQQVVLGYRRGMSSRYRWQQASVHEKSGYDRCKHPHNIQELFKRTWYFYSHIVRPSSTWSGSRPNYAQFSSRFVRWSTPIAYKLKFNLHSHQPNWSCHLSSPNRPDHQERPRRIDGPIDTIRFSIPIGRDPTCDNDHDRSGWWNV